MDRRHGQDPLGSKLVFLEVPAKMVQVTFSELETSLEVFDGGLAKAEVDCGQAQLDLWVCSELRWAAQGLHIGHGGRQGRG